jgi:hypothetical protein
LENAADRSLAAVILVSFAALGFASLTAVANGTEDSPARTAVYAVPGEIPAGGHLPFTYRSDTPLPSCSDGRFETSVSVVGRERGS